MNGLDYTVGLDPRLFEQGERRVVQSSARMRGRLQTDFRANSRSLAAFARRARNVATAVTAVAAAIGVAAKRTVDRVAEIAAQADTAGVSFEAFQELKFAADRNLVSVDALTDGLKEMQLRIDEFLQTDGGPAEESLKRLGFTVEELKEGLKDPPRLFEEIIDRVKQLDQAAQVRILDELFGGTAAEQFQRLMDDASGSISAAREQARQLGVVLDEDYKRQVEEINQRWNTMVTIIGSNVRRAVIDLTNDVIKLVDRFREIEARGTRTLEDQSRNIALERLDIENEILRLRGRQRDVIDRRAGSTIDREIIRLQAEDQRLREMEAGVDAELRRRREALQIAASPTESLTFTPIATDDDNGGGGGRRSSAASEAERQAEAIRNVVEALRFEQDQLGRNETMQRVYNELKAAGVDINSEAGQEIARLVTQIEHERQALERGAEAARFMGDAVESAIMDMVPDIETGNAALDRLVNTLIEASAQAALFNKGPLAGLFSGGLPGLGRGGGRGLRGGLLIPGILHAGGTAGRDGYAHNRVAPMAAFTHARRFHQGSSGPIGPGEVPAILKQGEEVGWPGDLARKYGGNGHRLDVAVTGYLFEKDGQIVAMIDQKSQSAAAAVANAVPAMVDGRLAQRETRRIRPQAVLG